MEENSQQQFGLQKNHVFIIISSLKLLTDYKELKFLCTIEDKGPKLERWKLKLKEYNFEIIYQPGKFLMQFPSDVPYKHNF